MKEVKIGYCSLDQLPLDAIVHVGWLKDGKEFISASKVEAFWFILGRINIAHFPENTLDFN